MVGVFDYGYLATPVGQLNIAEIICLIGALISVGFTSRLYCELVDNLQWIYPELNTLMIRSMYQAFAIFCLTLTIAILLVHIYGIRFSGRNYIYINGLCIAFNILMGLMMVSIGICAAFWEDKLRRTPWIVRRGYYENQYQFIFGEYTHPRPGAAAASAIFAILSGILFLIEACTRPILNTGASLIPTHYTIPVAPIKNTNQERIIPIETTRSSHFQPRV